MSKIREETAKAVKMVALFEAVASLQKAKDCFIKAAEYEAAGQVLELQKKLDGSKGDWASAIDAMIAKPDKEPSNAD